MGHLPWINALSCILSLLHTIYIVSIYNGAWPLTSTCTPWPIKLHTKCTMLGLDVEQPLPWLRGIGVARLFYEHSVVCVGLEFQQRGAWPMHKKVYLQLIILYRFVIIAWQQATYNWSFYIGFSSLFGNKLLTIDHSISVCHHCLAAKF